MSKPGQYPECDTCINREYDPFQCESCNHGSNYEPEDDGEDTSEEMSYGEFVTWIRQVA